MAILTEQLEHELAESRAVWTDKQAAALPQVKSLPMAQAHPEPTAVQLEANGQWKPFELAGLYRFEVECASRLRDLGWVQCRHHGGQPLLAHECAWLARWARSNWCSTATVTSAASTPANG